MHLFYISSNVCLKMGIDNKLTTSRWTATKVMCEHNSLHVNRLILPKASLQWKCRVTKLIPLVKKTQVKIARYRLRTKRTKGTDRQDRCQNSSISWEIVRTYSNNVIADWHRRQCSGITSAIVPLTELNVSDGYINVPINRRLEEDDDVSKNTTYSWDGITFNL